MMKNTKNIKSKYLWIIHLLAILIVFSIPFFVNPRHNSFNFVDYVSFFVPMAAFVILFYINYFYLIKKFLFTKKFWTYIIINLLIISFFAFLLKYWNDYYFTNFILPNWSQKIPPRPHYGVVLKDVSFMIMSCSISLALRMTVQWYDTDRERTKIEAVASQAELKNLKSQLNPHFLFNTLNNIYSLMRIDPEKAQKSILELSKILRYVLSEDNQEKVSLKEEVSFIKNYIELMSLRLTGNVSLTVNIAPEVERSEHSIASLLFISLIENAFKHGVSQSEPSFIDVSLSFKKEKTDTFLCCSVANSYFPKNDRDLSGSGIGIENLKRRLMLLYPDTHTFTTSMDGDCYKSELCVKLN
jgi:two-component sensor histidine kinase